MSITKSRKIGEKSKKVSVWDEAIQEAEKQIKDLKRAIKTFAQHRDAGDEWPGFKTAGTAAESVPA